MINIVGVAKTNLLFALLPGRQQGQTAETLAAAIRVAPADIPALVSELQRDGQLVVEEAGSYFIADTLGEWRAYRESCFMAAAVDLAQRHRAMTRSAARRWPSQWRSRPAMIIGRETA
ncbi:MAG: hypothetical protein JXA21_24160 [Anaerolineae bacterium]|nr:hypothetical protein [Anaerolineae bacterium]